MPKSGFLIMSSVIVNVTWQERSDSTESELVALSYVEFARFCTAQAHLKATYSNPKLTLPLYQLHRCFTFDFATATYGSRLRCIHGG